MSERARALRTLRWLLGGTLVLFVWMVSLFVIGVLDPDSYWWFCLNVAFTAGPWSVRRLFGLYMVVSTPVLVLLFGAAAVWLKAVLAEPDRFGVAGEPERAPPPR